MNTNDDGRLTDVFIEDLLGNIIHVYADDNLLPIIKAIPGIVWAGIQNPTHYLVHLDPRYDREWVKREIEACIKCAE